MNKKNEEKGKNKGGNQWQFTKSQGHTFMQKTQTKATTK